MVFSTGEVASVLNEAHVMKPYWVNLLATDLFQILAHPVFKM